MNSSSRPPGTATAARDPQAGSDLPAAELSPEGVDLALIRRMEAMSPDERVLWLEARFWPSWSFAMPFAPPDVCRAPAEKDRAALPICEATLRAWGEK